MSLSEADTRAKLIDPALYQRGWTEDQIKREETAGAVDIINGKARRRARGRLDYTLRVKVAIDTQPVALALIEAKREALPAGHGLDQGKGYLASKRLNVRFVFSSNGHQFVEYDSFTGMTSDPCPMSAFPTPADLRARYEQGMGFSLDAPAARPLLQPYSGGEGARRYYQDAAIRAVMEQVARCATEGAPASAGARALLSLATGAGKTFIAVNLLKRISDAGQLKRALFLCDREELRTQALAAFQNVFGADAAEVKRVADGTATGGNYAKNARIHIATYQTLGVASEDGDAGFLTTFYPPDYFSHIVIDECHRSAWGKWSEVLTRNRHAVQIGLTATPRELTSDAAAGGLLTPEAQQDAEITANNLKYFGEPVYEYTMTQAMEDGYLAACEIQKGRVDLDAAGLTRAEILAHHPVNSVTGERVGEERVEGQYRDRQFEDRIQLPDRVKAMCADLFAYLCETGGPEQKTIIFCARDAHAGAVAAELNNQYAAWCAQHGRERLDWYAFRCTAAASGNDQLPDLRASSASHFIATTVDLLSTGVDVPVVRNIVFFKYLKSPISFIQMVGRGTRIDTPTNKLMFRVYDYTAATDLFGHALITRPPAAHTGPGAGPELIAPPEPEPPISVEGFEVHITDAGRYIVADVDGAAQAIPVEEYKARLAARLVQETPTLAEFRTRWIRPEERLALIGGLLASGCSPNVVRLVDEKNDYDLYDVLAELGWGLAPRTRRERTLAFTYKHEDWLNGLPPAAAATLRAIAGQFEVGGTDGLESQNIFNVRAVARAGGVRGLSQAGQPAELLLEAKRRMFAA